MKILFLVYHGFSEVSGISKKIHHQVKGLRENGYEVHLCYYGYAENGHKCRYIDDEVIEDYGKGFLPDFVSVLIMSVFMSIVNSMAFTLYMLAVSRMPIHG